MTATQRVIVGADDVSIDSIHIAKPIDGGADVFREFTAPIDLLSGSEQVTIGQITGWVGWAMLGEDWFDAADAISENAATLGAAAATILEELSAEPEQGLLIDRIHLEPTYRGNRLTATVIEQLHELLRLEPWNTLTLLYPEPQQPDGGPIPDGPARDAAPAHLQEAYRASGLEPWLDSGVWWRPID